MAKNTYKSNTFKQTKKKEKSSKKLKFNFKISFLKDRRFHLTFGFFLLISSLFLLTAFISYLFTGKADQSVVEAIGQTGIIESGREAENWLGSSGAYLSHYFIFRWFGLAAFFTPPLLFIVGYKIVFRKQLISIYSMLVFSLFFTIWLSILLGYLVFSTEGVSEWGFLSGGIGYQLSIVLEGLIGWGTILLLIFSLIAFIIYFFNVTTILGFKGKIKDGVEDIEKGLSGKAAADEKLEGYVDEKDNWPDKTEEIKPVVKKQEEEPPKKNEVVLEQRPVNTPKKESNPGLELDVTLPERKKVEAEEPVFSVDADVNKENTASVQENYDPTLDLGSYKYPSLQLLDDFDTGVVQVTKEELEQNKDKIIETLVNFKIGISSIKATIGPTVTLYEIVPEAGVKISKIKNLEDDIALSLAALGIRIIAPIPGKGTIGIEVPNENREMVGIKSVFSTEKFMKSDKELPVALGRTISNEVHVIDLAKMPHILMAGATGQGKSVGLNVLLTSLLYKKHPSQLKLVLVDPKKVELTLFNKIERHFLAKLPNTEEAIITDTKKVVNTLNSLCIEMDNRYDLLKDAGSRNLKEYNAKFINRRLNPEKGHRFLPYIVLVIDELADLMMTAGKEVETPIARLAQLARAIGIHLVVATQRPSVNVITGIIKANFPARLSFRVTSKIDSRTILDTGGADQLIGMGDMLLSQGSDMIRLQCAFVDTPEVERICEYIGEQRGYESAYLLPEYVGDDESSAVGEVDLADRDALFDDAARLIVLHQQGSTSLIQRKLKLGYNRAGRIIDQLEAAGIVGPFEGSKAREVLVSDEYSLEQLLSDL
ncbi:FtsK/SpoIIIE family DNA translocase [Fulvivirga sediminis]|uniref:DNA translocase FtsK 4TM domain-containing protein n=1 Tax=Fulvivirga sediminis TaxID=2803949 RepID=A0A937JYS0_9BACT|nr:DNA translocase FtsK [Fulvivirga sediminis]MBL3656693.1 DNA translocase FtsK 4TM domain-containing protein [Fulvivirga sediminis]